MFFYWRKAIHRRCPDQLTERSLLRPSGYQKEERQQKLTSSNEIDIQQVSRWTLDRWMPDSLSTCNKFQCYVTIFGTSVFNKVVRWHRLGEVENVYVAYNFSHFAIFLLVEIWQSSNKKKQKMLLFLRHGVYCTTLLYNAEETEWRRMTKREGRLKEDVGRLVFDG